MRRIALMWSIVATTLVCAGTSSVSAQEATPRLLFKVIPLSRDKAAAVMATAGTTSVNSLPMWNYTTTASRDGNSYSGMMVGRSPFFHGARTTTINVILIPVKITITNASNVTAVFDPTQIDANCLPNGTATAVSLTQQSPILTPTSFTMNGVNEGSTQYIDAFQRANFHSAVNPTGDRYHIQLNLMTTLSVVTLTFNSPDGAIATADCGNVGVIDRTKFDATVEPNFAFYSVEPTMLPVFLFYNVVMTDGSPDQKNPFNNCCTLGYHSGKPATNSGIQLYAVADYDSSGSFNFGSPIDISVLAHEVGETVNDPTGTNATPAWGHIGQDPNGCQSNLEVGDPLNTTRFPAVMMPNGVAYHPQELAFFSWFFGAPSIGAGGKFSNNGTFTTDAGSVCQ